MDFTRLTLRDLQLRAKQQRITGYSKLRKSELVSRLQSIQMSIEAAQASEVARQEMEQTSRDNRPLVLRIQLNGDQLSSQDLEEPFSALFEEDNDANFYLTPIFGQPDEDVGNFPQNIETFLWINSNVKDIEYNDREWRTLVKLTNGVYVFFTAGCIYTGFSVEGNAKMWASRDPRVLIQYAMSDSDFRLYEQETVELDDQ